MTELEKSLIKNNELLIEQVASQNTQVANQNEQISFLSTQNAQLQKQNEIQINELRLLREQIEYLTKKLFGNSTEKSDKLNGQVDLFEDEESFRLAETTEEKTIIEEIKYKRKKRVGYKAELTKDLRVEEVHCKLSGDDCLCDWCKGKLHHIGKTYSHEEVVFVPATMYKKVYYRHSYECLSCKADGADAIKSASVPKQAITHSLSSPSILAELLYQKIELSLPFYRQEKEWLGWGLKVPRRTLANWFITCTEKWLKPIWNKLKEHLLNEELLHADETYYNVLSSDKEKTYYWLFRTIEQAQHPIILFQHALTRGQIIPKTFLNGFKGFLHCDAYSAYGTLEHVTLVNCWAHLRRKFVEAGGLNNEDGKAKVGLRYCNELFKLEEDIKGLSPEEKQHIRDAKARKILESFWNWIASFRSIKGSKLGKAINYALNNKSGLMNFLLDGRCALSNNIAERSIRPTTVGRKNWNFSASERGAIANGIVYSLVDTAKANGIIPRKYFEFLFEKLPNLVNISDPVVIEEYLPWAKQIQSNCK